MIEKSPFENHSNILFSQGASKDAKINLKISIFNIFVTEGEKSNFVVEKPGRYTLLKKSKLTLPITI